MKTRLTPEFDLFAVSGKRTGFIRLPHSVHRSAYGFIPIPVAVIACGVGPSVLLMAGNHGDEYEGQVALGNRRAALDAGLDRAMLRQWLDGMLALLAANGDWLRSRGKNGFVRRAHGDLHLGNLCLWLGRPVAFDALEFDEQLATIDTGYDLAFVLMDLDLKVGRAAANRVLNRYLARTGDWGMTAGLPLFLSMRAMIRAHVEATKLRPAESQAYLTRALAYQAASPGVVVAVGGLPGTGKSTLARALAPALGAAPGAVVLRSDEIRKRQQGVAPEQKLPPAAYSAAASAAVFSELFAAATDIAGTGHAVVADAMFLDPVHRARIAAAAGAHRFLGVWLQAPLAELERRVAARTRRSRSGDASDADVAVLRRAAAADTGPGAWLGIDATDAAAALAAVRAALARMM